MSSSTPLAVAYPQLNEALVRTVVDRGELTLYIEREHLIGIATVLRNHENLRFELLSSVSGVDYFDAEHPNSKRLHVVYNLTSMTYRRRLRLEVAVGLR